MTTVDNATSLTEKGLPDPLTDRVSVPAVKILRRKDLSNIPDDANVDTFIAGIVRHRVVPEIGRWAISNGMFLRRQKQEDIALLLTELIANASIHGGGVHSILYGKTRATNGDRRIVLAVVDNANEESKTPPRDNFDEYGRGINILRALSVDMGSSECTDVGNKVVCAVSWVAIDPFNPTENFSNSSAA